MADNKKYYYLKLKENFFDSDAMIVLESMQDGYLYSNILMKLYLRSLKNEGKLMFNDRIPYNAEILAQVTRHKVGVVEKAIQIFQELDLIEILENGAIFILDIQNFIGQSSTEADRVRVYRNKIEAEKKALSGACTNVRTNVRQTYDKCAPEIEKDLDLEKEREIEKELERDITPKEKDNTPKGEMISKPKIDYQKFVNYWNNTCLDLPKVIKLTKSRKQAIRLRLNEFGEDEILRAIDETASSDFLCGKVNDFTASFDWILKTANLTKILEGNYKNKKSQSNYENQESSNPFLNLLQSGELSNDEVNTIF